MSPPGKFADQTYSPNGNGHTIDAAPVEPRSTPIIVSMDTIAPRKIQWLWPNRIPLGRVSLWAGPGGVGKGMTTMDVVARVTTGSVAPDGEQMVKGPVLIISGEDDPADVIRPRLDAAGADVAIVHLLRSVARRDENGEKTEIFFTLEDVRSLEAAVEETGPVLVVIDPVGSFIGGETDGNTDNAVRAVLAPVSMLAEKYNFAALCIAHHRKTTGKSADELVLGSRAFTALARVVYHFFEDTCNPDRRLMLPGKSNLARRASGLAFAIGGEPAVVQWEAAPVDQTADQFLAEAAKPGPEPTARKEAEDLIRELLSAGPRNKSEIKTESKERDIHWKAMLRASKSIGVIEERCQYTKQLQWRFKKDLGIRESVHLVQPVPNEDERDKLDKFQDSLDLSGGAILRERGRCVRLRLPVLYPKALQRRFGRHIRHSSLAGASAADVLQAPRPRRHGLLHPRGRNAR
jgi:hypothetical protein